MPLLNQIKVAMANQKVPQTLISIAALFLMVANMALSQTTHIVVPPLFNDLTFQGNAFIPLGTNHIRLTKPLPRIVGRVMYSKPFTFWGEGKQVEFETKLTFKITLIDGRMADGITFFIAPAGSTIPVGSEAPNLGIFNSSGVGHSIFAVEFDTFVNAWDPPYPHIGIDVNSRISVETAPLDTSVLEEEVTLSIKYDQAKNNITVKAHQAGLCKHYNLSYELDLSTILEKEVQVGISASTGDISFHDIHYWEFTANMIYNNSDATVDGAGIRQVVST